MSKIFRCTILDGQYLDLLKSYKYKCVDSSPISKYIMHPFWETCVKYVPTNVHPNVLTVVGGLLVLLNFFIFCWFDWYLLDETNSSSLMCMKMVPKSLCFVSAVLFFISYTLDGIDGKQARRTQTSSPLGELFDHAIDSLTIGIMGNISYSINGASCILMQDVGYYMFILAQASFFLAHWEKCFTGVLYLPWSYDFGMISFICTIAVAGTIGDFFTYNQMEFIAWSIKWLFYLTTAFITLPVTTYNIWRTNPSDGTQTRGSFYAFMEMVLVTISFTVWKNFSPGLIYINQRKIFISYLGIQFSFICFRLILHTMAKARIRSINKIVLPPVVISIAVLCGLIDDSIETKILICLFAASIVSYVHYAINAIMDIKESLNIQLFTIKKLK